MSNNQTLTLQEFFDKCAYHDWTYMMSDDGSVYRRGSEAHSKLQALAKQSPEHQAIFDSWYNYIWSGSHMGTEKAEKPVRPE